MFRNVGSSLAAVVLVASLAAAAQAATFSDGTFNPANWNNDVYASSSVSATPVVAVTQETSGGNPGNYRRMEVTYPGGGTIYQFHALSGATWDPSVQGEIEGINASFDLNKYATDSPNFWVALRQGNTVFRLETAVVASTLNTWQNFNYTNLVQNSFREGIVGISGNVGSFGFDGNNHPNFTTSGGPIQFGFMLISGAGVGSPARIGGIDNFSLTVIPEPASMALMGLGTLLIVSRRRTATKH